MPDEAELRFHDDLRQGARRIKREIGYNPVRYVQLLGELGGVGAARQLLHGRDTSDTFVALWEAGHLEASIEALVLLPWYRHLFDDQHLDTARRRLNEHGFDIDRFLLDVQENPPAWALDSALSAD
ncbi:hypothetical protein GCM10010129_24060 [Streptomyces fumigatiscleroticus]|nr:hypothetical protein GCM10010129_24060 [Streptomyces fumigatiscleroticus]